VLAPGPVAECDDVGAAREQAVCDLRRDAPAGRSVLAVDDADVRVELAAQVRQALLDRASAGRREDVRDEEDAQPDRL
jgi:hypothetical protein